MSTLITEPPDTDRQAFTSFYDAYVPKLWGLILAANLPASQAEAILVNTLLSAWQCPNRQQHMQKHTLPWLVGLACAEGMPVDTIKTLLRIRPRIVL